MFVVLPNIVKFFKQRICMLNSGNYILLNSAHASDDTSHVAEVFLLPQFCFLLPICRQ